MKREKPAIGNIEALILHILMWLGTLVPNTTSGFWRWNAISKTHFAYLRHVFPYIFWDLKMLGYVALGLEEKTMSSSYPISTP